MWAQFKEFLGNYKSVIMKASILLFFLFLIAQYQQFGKRSAAHMLQKQIQTGFINEVCIVHSSNIYSDKRGTFAVHEKAKIYIPDKWISTIANDNLYLAIIMDEKPLDRDVYEVDSINAKLILRDEVEGCRSFGRNKPQFVN